MAKLTAKFWKEKCDIIENMYREEIDRLYEEKFNLAELRKLINICKLYRRENEDNNTEDLSKIIEKIQLNINRILSNK